MSARIALANLPPRRLEFTNASLDRTLQRLGAAEGSACRVDCDCRIGLVCAAGVCAPKE
jgi:hypothetical protein